MSAEPGRWVGLTRGSAWLVGWGAVGFTGAVLVMAGAAQPASPFASKLPGSWWFGVPVPPGGAAAGTQWQWLGVAAVYAGVVALLAAWYGVVTVCRRGGVASLRPLVGLGVAWAVPLVVGPPLMSRDVYAYAAQGAFAARGGDPYLTSVARLAGSPYSHLVDPLWRHATSPYGPLFLEFARGAAAAGGRHVLVTVLALRLVAVAGMILLAVAVPPLARSYGRPAATAFALAVLNPLLLLTLVGGAHNDALMLGLLMAGVALCRAGRLVPAVVVCALAATVKVPAFAGVVFVGWTWPGATATWRRRLGTVMGAVAGGAAVVAAVSLGSGWGWRWLTAADPGKVVSWLDPATAAGLLAARVMAAAGLGAHTDVVVGAARVVALVIAAVIGLVLLWRTDRIGLPAALGWTLLAVAVLGPVVWPWYETWGLTLVAVTAGTASRRAVLIVSAVGCFATIPRHISAHGAAPVVAALLLALWTAALAIADVRCRSVRCPLRAPAA
jgi:alpha-1,6-mannosyltransferase